MHLKGLLESIGRKQSPRQPCLYSKGIGEFILVYVDDLMIVAPNLDDMKQIKSQIGGLINFKYLGEIHDYSVIEVMRNRERKTFYLRQVGLIDDIVHIMHPEKIRQAPMSTDNDPSAESDPLYESNHNKYRDNTAAQTTAEGQSGNVTKSTKYIEIRYHIVKELIESENIKIQRIPTDLNTADTFTKHLDAEKFTAFHQELNLCDHSIHQSKCLRE